MRNVLITGAASYLGRHLAARLARRQAHVTAFSRRPADLPVAEDRVADLAEAAGRQRLAEAARDQDVIVHLAHSLDQPAVGVDSLKRMAESRPAGTRIVLVSSVAVYGHQPFGVPIPETAPRRPVTVNGEIKKTAEDVLADDPTALILRLPQISGRRMEKHILAGLVRTLKADRPVEIHHDGYITLDFVDIDPLAEGLAELVMGEATGVYNIGSGRPVLLYDLAKRLRADLASRSEIVVSPRREGMCWAVPDRRKALEALSLDLACAATEIAA